MQNIPFDFSLSEIALRLFVTLFLTGLIGWDRERLHKPAGLRTHILVGVGSALIMLISTVTGPMVNGIYQVDPRIVANVVTGIGFLGAGTILHYKDGLVSGLTTAASLWVAAAIGMAIGCGFYSGGILTTVIVLFVLYLMGLIDGYYEGRLYRSVTLHVRITPHLTESAKEILRDEELDLLKVETESVSPSEKYVVFHIKPISINMGKELSRRLAKLPGVKEVTFNS
ncbi:MAG TPA: MgtC/SapB family protein [bacterium]|jgi:putative Mg2+ transporter-C (MgtC) family protein|nr:MgtC/SapB family protein [bacterium]